jgi:hypothetical protein
LQLAGTPVGLQVSHHQDLVDQVFGSAAQLLIHPTPAPW